MSAFCRFFFPVRLDNSRYSFFLLAFRILFGLLFLAHGWQKLENFGTLSQTFSDPLGIGHTLSLLLALFAEIICSLGFLVGFLYRLVLLPMIFTMIIAFFVIHGHDPFLVERELPFIYMIVFIVMYLAGPGKYSFDHLIGIKLSHKK